MTRSSRTRSSTRSASAVARWRAVGYPGIRRSPASCWPTGRRGSRAPAVLLPDRGARDRDLPHRGGRAHGDAWIENGSRERTRTNAACTAGRAQDGDRDRQDRRDGDAHRLAGAQQGGQPPGQALQRHVPDRDAGHHDPRSAARAAARTTPTTTTASATSSPPTSWATRARRRSSITNFHAFQLGREKIKASPRLTKKLLPADGTGPFKETPDEMVRRVLRDARATRQQHRRAQRRGPPLLPRQAAATERGARSTADEREEAKTRRGGRVWLTGLQAVAKQARHPGGLRPVGDAVLPAGSGLSRRARSSRGSCRTSP